MDSYAEAVKRGQTQDIFHNKDSNDFVHYYNRFSQTLTPLIMITTATVTEIQTAEMSKQRVRLDNILLQKSFTTSG